MLRPLSARSVVLSVLLGTHPPALAVRELVQVAELFGISDATLRVALTRMVAAGDLLRAGTVYRLSDRLVERQRRQDDAVEPDVVGWDGTWEMVAVTASGRSAADRAALRARLTGLRLAELREGLWLRPANLRRAWPADLDGLVERFTGAPDGDPAALAQRLWRLDEWAQAAADLLRRFHATTAPADRIACAAAIVRTLLTDPVLPADLLPDGWPAAALRVAYRDYQDELRSVAANPGSDPSRKPQLAVPKPTTHRHKNRNSPS